MWLRWSAANPSVDRADYYHSVVIFVLLPGSMFIFTNRFGWGRK